MALAAAITAQAAMAQSDPFTPEQRAVIDAIIRENAELRARANKLEAEVASLRTASPKSGQPDSAKDGPAVEWLRPSLLAEVDYRLYPSEEEGTSGFAVARLRPGLVFAPARWFRGIAAIELAGEGPEIIDAYAKLSPAPWVDVDIGYSKPPLIASFAFEPVQGLAFPTYSAVADTFRIDRDVGVGARVHPREAPIEVSARLGNGTGSALGNDDPTPAGYALADVVLGRAWAAREPASARYGLRAGVSGLIEKARDHTGLTAETPLHFVYNAPTVVAGTRWVGEAHAIAYLGPARIVIEGAVSEEQRSKDDDGNPDTPRADLDPVTSYGVGAEVGWVALGRPRSVGTPPRPEPTSTFRGGALEVAFRYDGLFLNRGASDVAPSGSNGASAAIEWWPVDFISASLSGYVLRYEVPPAEEPERGWSFGVTGRFGFYWGLSRDS